MATNCSLFEPSLNAAWKHSGFLYKCTIIVPDFPLYLLAYEAGKWSPHSHVHTRCLPLLGHPWSLLNPDVSSVLCTKCNNFLYHYYFYFPAIPHPKTHHILFFFSFFFFRIQHADCTRSAACTLTLRALHSLQVFQWRQTGLLCH